MKDSHLVAHHIRLLNGRIFQKLLSQDPEALYRSEQGKILAVLWNSETGCATEILLWRLVSPTIR